MESRTVSLDILPDHAVHRGVVRHRNSFLVLHLLDEPLLPLVRSFRLPLIWHRTSKEGGTFRAHNRRMLHAHDHNLTSRAIFTATRLDSPTDCEEPHSRVASAGVLVGGTLRNGIVATTCAALLLSACSSRPREFTPTLSAAPAEETRFDAAYSECKQLYVTGKLDSNGRLASGGAGIAAGGAVGAAGAAGVASAGLYGGMAVASATIVLMPVAIIGGAVGMAKIKRHNKEKAIQRVMAGCLHDRGYEVASWQKAPKARSDVASSPLE